MKKVVLLLSLIWSFEGHATTFYGADKLQHAPRTKAADYFIQVGSFKREAYALEAKKKYESYGFPIRIVRHGVMYAVIIGPVSNQTFRKTPPVKAHSPPKPQTPPKTTPPRPSFFQSIFKPTPKPSKPSPQVRIIRPKTPPIVYAKNNPSNVNWSKIGHVQSLKKRSLTLNKDTGPLIAVEKLKEKEMDQGSQWYVEVEGGAVFPNLPSTMTVLNGSSYAAPYDVDSFSVNQSTQHGTFIVNIGRSMSTTLPYLTRYAIGLRYQLIPSKDITGTVTQYSMPQFLNYYYSWGIYANALTADLKLNFVEWNRFSPYFNLGLGFAASSTDAYIETPIAPVTPRYTPGFAATSNSNFTFHVGLGLDYTITPAWRLSVGYEYLDLGKFESGNGLGSWSAEHLDLGYYHANSVLIGVTYFMG